MVRDRLTVGWSLNEHTGFASGEGARLSHTGELGIAYETIKGCSTVRY